MKFITYEHKLGVLLAIDHPADSSLFHRLAVRSRVYIQTVLLHDTLLGMCLALFHSLACQDSHRSPL